VHYYGAQRYNEQMINISYIYNLVVYLCQCLRGHVKRFTRSGLRKLLRAYDLKKFGEVCYVTLHVSVSHFVGVVANCISIKHHVTDFPDCTALYAPNSLLILICYNQVLECPHIYWVCILLF